MEESEKLHSGLGSSSSSMDEDDLELSNMEGTSISSKLRVGYFSMDRACQTEVTEIVGLKETTELLTKLVLEIKNLKKDLYYTKLSLQASCEANIQSRSLDLYKRVNDGVVNLEKLYDKRTDNIRRSFRTQLQNAIQKISEEYRQYYTGVSEQEKLEHMKRMNEVAREQEEQRRAQLAQQDLIDMMKLQMDSSSDEKEDDERVERPLTPDTPAPSTAEYIREIEGLREYICTLEPRIDELEQMLNESNSDNKKIGTELERVKRQWMAEQKKYNETKKEVVELQILLENERKSAKRKLEDLQTDLQKKHRNEFNSAQEQAKAEANRKLKELEAMQADKLREQQLLEQKRIDELMMAKEEKEVVVEDGDLAVLRRIEKKQRQEIARLRKELERAKRVSEIKIAVLKQNLHALKDEMFLRMSLQRQSAKVQPAIISYCTDGPDGPSAVLEANTPPAQERQFQLPNIIQGRPGLQLTRALTAGSINRISSTGGRPTSAPKVYS